MEKIDALVINIVFLLPCTVSDFYTTYSDVNDEDIYFVL